MYDFLLDTNVLIYAANPASKFQKKARGLLQGILEGKINGCVSTQNLYEFYSIVTDPKRIERPLNLRQASLLLQKYIEADNLPKISPKETNLFNLLDIVRKYKVSRQEIFDAVLVATMMDNSVKSIYTADEKLFRKISIIKVINPFK